ncbi:hypothetical protein J6590_085657 [Homalodisca vitripennis]|nr:hypothetical protein J6590_085657 [Homalodisca vitripennis]
MITMIGCNDYNDCCVQVSLGDERLAAGIDPAEDYSMVEMYDSHQSVMMATRRTRQLLGNEIAEHARHHHLDLKRLDVQCSNQGMQVRLEFLEPFDGVVYSKGHFEDPKCRHAVTSNNMTDTRPREERVMTSPRHCCDAVGTNLHRRYHLSFIATVLHLLFTVRECQDVASPGVSKTDCVF